MVGVGRFHLFNFRILQLYEQAPAPLVASEREGGGVRVEVNAKVRVRGIQGLDKRQLSQFYMTI